jgi:hypothetical protein
MPDSINYDAGTILTYFARLDAAPQGTQQILSDVTSPGVDGVGLRLEARRASPFEGVSEVYVADINDAAVLRAVYDSLCGKTAVLTVNGKDYSDIAVLSVVVEPFQLVARAIFVTLPDGTTSTGSNAVRVRARWAFQYAGAP